MKTLAIICLSLGAVSVAACVPPNARRHREPLKPVARLDCPDRQGDLRRTSAAPDGRACHYSADDGSEVELRLIPVSGSDPDAALARVEGELAALMPQETPPDAAGAGVDASATSWSPSTAAAAAQAEADAHADADAAAPAADRPGRKDEQVNIHLPGVNIQADDDKADIRVGGLQVKADDRSDRVHVAGGPPFGRHGAFSIDANDRGAVIRAKGAGPNVRATLIMASEQPGPRGWRAVGYQARGPRTGPLVVAVIHAKGDDHDEVFDTSGRLAARAAGG